MSRWEWEDKVPAKWGKVLKAPDPEEELKGRSSTVGVKTETPAPTWNEAALELRYHRKELQDFMTQNPLKRILQPTQIGDQTGPVTAPVTANDKLEANKILMNLLQEAGLVAGAFDAEDLFRPDLRFFQLSTKMLFDKLKVLVGEKVTDPSTTSSPDSPTQIGSTGDRASSPFVSAAEADSDESSEPRRISLGPAGAAMLQTRSKVRLPGPRLRRRQEQLNVAGVRARLKAKDGGTKERKEHVDHFIEALGDPELADRLVLLRLSDADGLEEVLRALDRAKSRQKKSAAVSSRYRQKGSPSPAPAAPAKQVRAIQIQAPDSESDSSSDGSDSNRDEHRRIYLAANGEHSPPGEEPKTSDREQLDRRTPDPRPGDTRPRYQAEGADRGDARTAVPRSTPIWGVGDA
ncbi:hypothetical protein PR003_g1776 [Phytophthora rubi]|uniref:Uncharacterized protein n=1 Tax=Phytophthora rubi TaxID=129364 RepID=A0A6A4G3N4_9STRA|nr:hypothetical protein PR003_g1776 [Phytophthora rubi]